MGDWFVRPETTRLELSDGQWILVKRRLNAGEQRAAFRRQYTPNPDTGKLQVNPDGIGIAMVTAYLIDWSLTDHRDAPVEIAQQPFEVVLAALDNLEDDRFDEIKTAIEAHDAAQRKAREQEKKLRAGVTTSPTTSPSPDASAGAMSGSATSTLMST